MKKSKKIYIVPEQLTKDFWSTVPRIGDKAQEQLAIPEPETKEKISRQGANSYQREIIAPEDALEQFASSLCFAEYLFQAYDTDYILELHPYRKPSGWLWDCRMTPSDLPYRTINLEMPKISKELYQEMYDRFYSEEYSLLGVYALIGNAYKGHLALDVYADRLRNQLRKYLIELSITA